MTHRQWPAVTVPAIPDDNAPLPPARRPTRWTVRRGRAIAFVLIGLALAVSLLAVYATYEEAQRSAAESAAVNERLDLLEQERAERTRQRDQERDQSAARDAEVRRYLCSVLGQMPAGPSDLEELREALACDEPGVPPLPGAEPPPGPTAPAPGPLQPPPASGGSSEPPAAAPAPSSPPPTTPAPPATASPTPVPPERTDRGLLGDIVCALPLLC
ncbi:hypothetical protein [Blastococcus sp. CCUG 61487]|uniref:hypothetical protein n=1 Tax=Blastococcus sp. CCUG 61487 TaxID=1840703 RepID=UPI0010C01ED8|nr:hypothetical protein [Blastococcus sp. CCUG 61487]TKJ25207.1 hypothetical protein A6V29_04080 [Blastococcus sp. CCUG 61487]